jgi:hypothetical protein
MGFRKKQVALTFAFCIVHSISRASKDETGRILGYKGLIRICGL